MSEGRNANRKASDRRVDGPPPCGCAVAAFSYGPQIKFLGFARDPVAWILHNIPSFRENSVHVGHMVPMGPPSHHHDNFLVPK